MTAADWPIVREVAIIFGYIMRGIYLLLSSMGIYSIPLCIITFVVVSKFLILPSTYKKQKYAVIAPKLIEQHKKIIQKYEKRLEHPLTKNKINIDRGFLLTRYDIQSSTSLAMTLLQLPVLFALYAIVQNMERFVPELNSLSPEQLASASTFFGISINEIPGFSLTPALIFPILTAVLQLVEMFQMSMLNRTVNNGKVAGGISNALMIAMMFYFSAELPVVCSIYWIIRSVTDIIIVFIIQSYVKSKDISFFENKKFKKDNKKRIKKGLQPLSSPAYI
jgi:YidC/Oxa1 family membrane protein insertase